ncbi:MAG: HK97 gp10 family phage protein [Negativibacillus sp.]
MPCFCEKEVTPAKDIKITLIDNSGEVLEAFQERVLRALERCGAQGEDYAKNLAPVGWIFGGSLRSSISHKVDPQEPAVYIGTNSEYGPYVELGTGKYYPGGRKTPWAYKDAYGNWYRTEGSKAQPYLKPAVADHGQTYRNIIEDELKKK